MIDIDALKNKLLLMAINGQLVEQNELEENANTFLTKIVGSSESDDFICDEEIPYTVPSNWRVCKFGQVVDFYLGKTPARGNKRYWENGVYPWISISDITNNGFIYDTTEKVSQEAYDECFSNGITKKGTLIMSFKLSIGKVAILGMDSFHNEAIISIFPKYDEDNIFRDYLFWMLPVISNNTDSHGAIKGNTLNKKSLSGMIVPIPPLAEQKRIVNKLNEVYLAIEKINELQTKFLSDKNILKNKIIDAGIQGKLTEQLESDGNSIDVILNVENERKKQEDEGIIKAVKRQDEISEDDIPFKIPYNWKWVRFGNVAYIVRGGSPRPIKQYITNDPNGINWIKIGDVEKGGKYIIETKEKIIPEGEKKSRKVYPGDFLLTNSMSFGRPYISKIEGCIHDGWLLIHDLKAFNQDYLYYLLSSGYLYEQFCKKASGATVDNLNIDKVSSAIIPLPPLDEQKRIADKLDSILSYI